MNEEEIEASLKTYNDQLKQVEQALQASGMEGNDDLIKLRNDLRELIKLTEESLLSLKKSRLLSMLGDATATPSTASGDGACSAADAEFAAFQASIADEVSGTPQSSTPASTGHNSPSLSPQISHADLDLDFDEIAGTKCRAPFSHSWGESGHLNAMVLCAEPLDADSQPKVRVLFCNPTHASLLPCPFFLEGRCKFDEEECRFSHGHVVLVDSLEEYVDPDYSTLTIGCSCLAKDTDSIWYKATLVDILEDHTYQVMFETTNGVLTVALEDILPIESTADSSDSDSDGEMPVPLNDLDSDSEANEEDALPVFLWRPQTTESLGDWEVHTRGIGSKLMARMGYVVGEGLGRNGQGRAEPVPIQLLPQGKSLDKIMELKELAGDRDLYDVMKKQKKKKHKPAVKTSKMKDKPKHGHVFDFINKKLGSKKGKIQDLVRPKHVAKSSGQQVKQIQEKDLKKKTNRDVNIQLFRTAEEMKNVEREITKLKVAIARNEGRDRTVMKQLNQKLASAQAYLDQLRTSQGSMERHMKSRSEHKKLTVF